jgi:hypothetical protein
VVVAVLEEEEEDSKAAAAARRFKMGIFSWWPKLLFLLFNDGDDDIAD